MTRLLRSFYAKLSAMFLVLLLVMAGLQAIVAFRIAQRRQVEVDQHVNSTLAQDMGREFEPLIGGGATEALEQMIHYMMVMNPAVEVYVLDRRGTILAYYTEPGKDVELDRVDLGPILSFLEPEHKLPILGDDPRLPGQKKHFSAAEIDLGAGERGYLYVVLRSTRYDQASTTLRERYLSSILGVSTLLALLTVAALGLVLFSLLTRRLEALAGAVKSFGTGHHEARALVGSQDEIGELAQSFNQMAETIVESLDRLKLADQSRRDLVANVSHDLRTPLASMRGYVETLLMKDDVLTREERKRHLEVVMSNADSLTKLVGDLFELSKLESPNIEPARERFSLSELTQDVVLKLKPHAEARGLEFTCSLPEDLCLVDADIGMIERVLTNIIHNAIAHSKKPGRVCVALTREDTDAVLSVSDEGPGIPSDELVHVFDRFYRGRGNGKGAGLGLAISRRIIDLHSGSIDVRSEVGKGSAFIVRLALA
jgi:signal transduction histidine kinase